eukprot:210650_1
MDIDYDPALINSPIDNESFNSSTPESINLSSPYSSSNTAPVIDDNPPAHAFNTADNIIKPPFSINDFLNYVVHGLNTNQFKFVIPNGKSMNIDDPNDFNGPDDADINQFIPIDNAPNPIDHDDAVDAPNIRDDDCCNVLIVGCTLSVFHILCYFSFLLKERWC